MKQPFSIGAFLVALSLAGAASGAAITSFTATPVTGSAFSTDTFTSSFAGNVATITSGTFSCTSAAGCNGTVANFSLTATGVTSTAPIVAAIDGSLSGSTPGTGTLSVPALAALGVTIPPFSIAPGTFSTTILSTVIPAAALPGGNLSVSGSLGLSLANGQTLTLPSSFTITVNAAGTTAPEPGTLALLGFGLVGLGWKLKRRTA